MVNKKIAQLDFASLVNEHACTSLADVRKVIEELGYNVHPRTIQYRLKAAGIRFCPPNEERTTLDDEQLLEKVQEGVEKLGGKLGVRYMQAFARADGEIVSRRRIMAALRVLDADGVERRRYQIARQTNPIPYAAPWFGYNFHADQHEKLQRYGLTLVMIVDGKTRMVLGWDAMSHKNNIRIYERVFRPVLVKYGIPRRVVIDGGCEFNLAEEVLLDLAHYRIDPETGLNYDDVIAPIIRVASTANNKVERLWREINQFVYDLKRCCILMEEEGLLSVDNSSHLFTISSLLQHTARIAVGRWEKLWNNHHMKGMDRPMEVYKKFNGATMVDERFIPTVDEAVEAYTGNLREEWTAGQDPVRLDDRASRDLLLQQLYTEMDVDRVVSQVLGGKFDDFVRLFQLCLRLDEEFE